MKENFKEEIMIALTNCPANEVSRKAFLWAASNLPDEGGVGSFSTGFKDIDHEKDSVEKAFGLNDKVSEELNNSFNKLCKELQKKEEKLKTSQVIEKFLNIHPFAYKLFLVRGAMEVLSELKEDSHNNELNEIEDGIKKALEQAGIDISNVKIERKVIETDTQEEYELIKQMLIEKNELSQMKKKMEGLRDSIADGKISQEKKEFTRKEAGLVVEKLEKMLSIAKKLNARKTPGFSDNDITRMESDLKILKLIYENL